MFMRRAFPFVVMAWLASLAMLVSFVPVTAVAGKDPSATATLMFFTVVTFLVLGLAALGCHLFGKDMPFGRGASDAHSRRDALS